MRRFALFSAALIVLIAIGSQPSKAGSLKESVCVCLPSRAAFIVRSVARSVTSVSANTTQVAAER
jgi:phosphoenolpyruvate synthase/pyruvate phosphate dikinase